MSVAGDALERAWLRAGSEAWLDHWRILLALAALVCAGLCACWLRARLRRDDEPREFDDAAVADPDWSFCPCCLRDAKGFVRAPCVEDPAKRPGGMYHCPDCGTMVLAGLPHPMVCVDCAARLREEQERWPTT